MRPSLDKHAAGIGGELQSGADFLEALGLFQYDDAEAASGERQRGRQSTDAGTGDDDRSGERHPLTDGGGQATLSFRTHSGGRASPAFRSAAKRYSVEQ